MGEYVLPTAYPVFSVEPLAAMVLCLTTLKMVIVLSVDGALASVSVQRGAVRRGAGGGRRPHCDGQQGPGPPAGGYRGGPPAM